MARNSIIGGIGRVALPVAVTLIVGCAESQPGGYIAGNIRPDQQCTYAAGNNRELVGVYDVSVASGGYIAAPLFVNQAVSRSGRGPLRTDARGLLVYTVEVSLQRTDGTLIGFTNGLTNPFDVPTSVFVPSSASNAVGEQVGAIELIPAAYRQQLVSTNTVTAAQSLNVVASVRARGRATGGGEVEFSPWNWAVTVCSGCLAVTGADDLPCPCFFGVNDATPKPPGVCKSRRQ